MLGAAAQAVDDEGKWVYRNLTQLHVVIGAEQFIIVDANGNGSYNDAGADGMAWEGRAWLFPLPAESERWPSTTGRRSRREPA